MYGEHIGTRRQTDLIFTLRNNITTSRKWLLGCKERKQGPVRGLLLRVLARNKDGLNVGDFIRFGAKWAGPGHVLEKDPCQPYCTVEM